MFTKQHSVESKQKISLALTGTQRSKSTMIKISDTLSKKQERQQNRNRSFVGRILNVYKPVAEYAKVWKLPIMSKHDFKTWAISDPSYEKVFDSWKESEFDRYQSPVVMRSVKSKGFVAENLTWDVKNNYSWWNEDSAIYKEVSERINTQQKECNQRNKEWRKKVRDEFKTKQKAKGAR
ncbi:MAG: NUMOD3 domain-containing DNA-binding protein [bacterium]